MSEHWPLTLTERSRLYWRSTFILHFTFWKGAKQPKLN